MTSLVWLLGGLVVFTFVVGIANLVVMTLKVSRGEEIDTTRMWGRLK